MTSRRHKNYIVLTVCIGALLFFTACRNSAGPSSAGGTPPGIPSNLSVSSTGDRSLDLCWTGTKGASWYTVYWGEGDDYKSPDTGKLSSIPGTAVTLTGLTNGTAYNIWVQAHNSSGDSGMSGKTSGTPSVPPAASPAFPPAPSGLRVSAEISGELAVSWNPVDSALSYNVYYRNPEIMMQAQKIDGITETNATITGLPNSTSYEISVSSVNEAGEGNAGEPISGTTLAGGPASPAGLILTPADGLLTAAWEAVPGAGSYKVYLGTTNNIEDAIPTTIEADADGYLAAGIIYKNLTNGSTYYVWVRAVNGSGESALLGPVGGIPHTSDVAPPAPLNVSALLKKNGHLIISFTPSEGATSYNIYWVRSTDGTVYTSPPETLLTKISGIAPSNGKIKNVSTKKGTYYIWVKALNGSLESGYSEVYTYSIR